MAGIGKLDASCSWLSRDSVVINCCLVLVVISASVEVKKSVNGGLSVFSELIGGSVGKVVTGCVMDDDLVVD